MPRLIFPLLIFFSRIIPHPANFAPVDAVALFGGAHLKTGQAWLTIFVPLFVSDLLISGLYGKTMLFVYSSYILIFGLGRLLKGRQRVTTVVAASLTSSILFFLITNFGVWLDPVSAYPKTFSGLSQSYLLALPFFRNTLLSDLFFSSLLFASYDFLKTRREVKKPSF